MDGHTVMFKSAQDCSLAYGPAGCGTEGDAVFGYLELNPGKAPLLNSSFLIRSMKPIIKTPGETLVYATMGGE